MNSMHIQSVFAAVFGISTRITVEQDLDGDILVTFDLADGTTLRYMDSAYEPDAVRTDYDFVPGNDGTDYDFASICFPVLKETK